MKLGTLSKSNMLNVNEVLEIDDLDRKLQSWANLVPKLKHAPILMKLGTQDI